MYEPPVISCYIMREPQFRVLVTMQDIETPPGAVIEVYQYEVTGCARAMYFNVETQKFHHAPGNMKNWVELPMNIWNDVESIDVTQTQSFKLKAFTDRSLGK